MGTFSTLSSAVNDGSNSTTKGSTITLLPQESSSPRYYFLKLKMRISSPKKVSFEEEMIERDSSQRTNS